SAEDARITLNFSQIMSGWSADTPIHPGDIDRMFISLVPAAYVGGSTVPLGESTNAWAELTDIRATGQKAMLKIG
ncbi:non-contractile tail sheath protein, partial [Escherichia coli]|uniref:non-contractile tail sheath protein n=1 Tax=Escherichia coli TaxID=562 RepID=UPI003CE46D2F